MIPVNKLPHLAFLFLIVSLSSCVDDEPKASFMVEQDPENKPLYATFTSTSKHAESLRWHIEGNYVTSPVLEYHFDAAGTYNIELEITNEDGEIDRVTQAVEIPYMDPCGDHWKGKDQEIFDEYFEENNITPLGNIEVGPQYVIAETGNEKRVTDNLSQRVMTQQVFYYLDGTVAFATTREPRYEEYGRFSPEIIEAIKLVGEGGKINFFYNSCEGFGASSVHGIPPYTPLIWQLELIVIGGLPCQC
ncbi:hypothetical protein [Parachryseolinea silvisoli]|jgi:hypothetical protein|uniref:hypothetical protein n=1 Tax=Parachryseolinea silvisoli TaxID=2873601 RepID=UPI002265EE96|nr:hypothetical protein [Parachryseolinea silvisoli]MCD9017241.1 hypothetical protein [Parachryseolinea silvisoli]